MPSSWSSPDTTITTRAVPLAPAMSWALRTAEVPPSRTLGDRVLLRTRYGEPVPLVRTRWSRCAGESSWSIPSASGCQDGDGK